MRLHTRPLVAVMAAAWIVIAASAQAVKFDGHVYQIVEVCERFQNRAAWAIGDGESWEYNSDYGTSFALPCDFESPYTAALVSSHGELVGQVVITRLPDAHGVQVIVLTQDGWLLDKTYAYAGHTPPPAYTYGKIRPALFPQSQEFECGDQVTYVEHIFEQVDTQTALLARNSIRANSLQEWRQTRNTLKREWRQSGKPLPWQRFLKTSLIQIAQETQEPACELWVSVKANVCRCIRTLPDDAILPLSGAVVGFRSLNKNNQVRWAYVTTDANGYYSYDSKTWNVAGYFADTDIWVESPTGVIVPDLNGVVLEAHRAYPGTLAQLYADFAPFLDGSNPAIVISPNTGARNGEIKAAKSVFNVDFYVIPD